MQQARIIAKQAVIAGERLLQFEMTLLDDVRGS
jgi:hypothetical protein